MIRRAAIGIGLALALGVPNALIAHKERLLASGTPVLLELAPVDPRSLIQGDYMALEYALTREMAPGVGPSSDGYVVVRLDEQGVAHWARVHERDAPLEEGELLLRYRRRGGRLRLGAEAFFFQEGHADRYAQAKYGELRVSRSGESVLVGLRDAQRTPLGPGRFERR